MLVSAGGAMLAPWDSGTLETLLGKADQEMHLRRSLRREATPATRRVRLRRLSAPAGLGCGRAALSGTVDRMRTGLLLIEPR